MCLAAITALVIVVIALNTRNRTPDTNYVPFADASALPDPDLLIQCLEGESVDYQVTANGSVLIVESDQNRAASRCSQPATSLVIPGVNRSVSHLRRLQG